MEVLLRVVASVYWRVQWEAVWAVGISARQQLSAELLWPWPYCHSDGHEQKEETAMLIDKEDNSGEPLPGLVGKIGRSSLTPWGRWGQN